MSRNDSIQNNHKVEETLIPYCETIELESLNSLYVLPKLQILWHIYAEVADISTLHKICRRHTQITPALFPNHRSRLCSTETGKKTFSEIGNPHWESLVSRSFRAS